jgi:hypothetical protein
LLLFCNQGFDGAVRVTVVRWYTVAAVAVCRPLRGLLPQTLNEKSQP